MRSLILVVPLLLITGCVPLAQIPQPYCETFSPLEQAVFRARLDEQTKPHEIRINCYAFSDEFTHDQNRQQPVETIDTPDV